MASMSVSGIVSGMDWESMIDEIITNAAKPAQVKVNKKTNLTNKKSLFEEMKVTMNSLQSSLSPLKLPSTYKAKTIDIERIDKNTSYKGVLTATANADAEVNVWDLTVNQLATAQINRSKQINDSNLTSTLNGVSGKTIYINAGGQKVGVEVKSSDTLESLKSRINTTLKTLESPIYVTASVVDNKLLLKSDYTGLGTMTGRETINYNYSTGINRLSNLSIPEEAYDNVKVTSTGKSYTIHKDFEIANGNEIRWKQYDRGNEVALGDSATVTYTMAGSDMYTKTGTYGTSEASVTGFSVKDMGTLANRLKITAGDDTYSYGKDFTLDSSGKVKWLEAAAPTTNEPSSYTVSYSKTDTYSYTTGERNKASTTINYTDEPESYIVKYNDRATGSYDVPVSKVGGLYDTLGINYSDLNTLYTSETGSELNIKAISLPTNADPNRTIYYLDPANISDFKLKDSNGTEYVYGRDYVIKTTDNTSNTSNGNWQIVWGNFGTGIGGIVNAYKTYKNVPGTFSDVAAVPSSGTQLTFSFAYDYDYSLTGRVSASDNDKTIHTIFGQDIENFNSSKLTIRGYEKGTDFEVKVSTVDGEDEISWITKSKTVPSKDDEIPAAHMTKFQEAYKNANGTSIPTISLTDADGVIRTYLDLAGDSSITLGNPSDYEYGRDYVIRVNDDRDGYVISWAITADENGDGKVDINDSNTVVTTYTQKKDISTEGMKKSPAGDTYLGTLSYSKDVTTTTTKQVSKTTADKPLSDILGVTVPSSDYSQLVISDGTKTYKYGTDYTIDDSGNITWIEQSSSTYTPQYPTDEYTLTYEAFDAIESTYTDSPAGNDVSINVGSGNGKIDGDKLSYEQILSYTGLTSSSSSDDWAKYFTLATTDGTTTYTYGTDYKIVQSDDTDSTSGDHKAKIEWISGGSTPSGNFKLTYGTDGGETISTSVTRDASDTLSTVAYNNIKSSTVTITQGSKTYYEGVDFELSGDSSNVVVTWKSDKKGGYEWYYPNPGSSYTLNVEDSNGTKTTYSGRRTSSASLNFISDDYGMTTANGTISVEYDGGLSYKVNGPDIEYDDGTSATMAEAIKSAYGISVTPTTGGTYTFNWLTPKLTTHSNLPSMNDELTVEYQYDANTFDLSDDGDGDLLYALGFTKSDGSYDDYTKAQGAEIVLNGETIEVDSNDIGADYDNEIIKGVTLHLKGTGEVTMDISHDAEKAVESIQSFVDNYNDLMTWMNTRMTEKQLDEDTAATVDSDDFRMRWGLLHGNSLLRQTKSQMRSLTSKNFTFTFTQRKSSEEIYGSMAFNGLKTASTLRLRIGSKYVDITIDPSDTLETIVAKLSDDTKNGPMHDFYYDENGQKLQSPLIKASVENDKLEIHSTDNQEITMSGSAAMNALKMNYTYKGLYQIGIESTSDDYGKSGELVFDTDEFMTALEDNPDEVQALMTSFVSEFSAWTSSMLSTSASGETKGTLTREIDNIQSQIDTINEYLERYQERLDRMEENLRTRYGNTETQFSKLSQQANSIAAILNQLNGTASGGGYGQASS